MIHQQWSLSLNMCNLVLEVSSGSPWPTRYEVPFVLVWASEEPSWNTYISFWVPVSVFNSLTFLTCSRGLPMFYRQISIVFNDGSNGVGVDFSHWSSWLTTSWTDFQPSLNSLCYFLMLKLFRYSFLKAFFSNTIVPLVFFQAEHKIQCRCAA